MIIDSHVNITHNGKWYQTGYDASLERLLREMEEANVEKCILISMPNATTNKYIASVINKYSEKFRGIGHIDFSQDLKREIDKILNMGLSGIKFHPRIQNIDLLNEKYNFFWEYLDNKGVIFIICGFLQVTRKNKLINYIEPLAYEKHIKRFPNIKFILTHAGCHKVLDTYFLCKSYDNFFTDISYSINVFKETLFYKDFEYLVRNVSNKVLYGSDYPEITLNDAKIAFIELTKNIPKDKINNLTQNNALKLFWG